MAGCVCAPEPISTQAVTLRPQETSMWCWAASGEMTMDFLGGNISQCDEANKRFNRSDCCHSPVPAACVNGGWPEYDKYQYAADRTSNAALSWEQVKEQIYCKKKPFAFSWHWPGGGGHMMVVSGYVALEGGGNYVYVKDPWAPNVGNEEIITYDYYVSSTGHHTHWDDFYNITKQ
jgi:hypothetical protein